MLELLIAWRYIKSKRREKVVSIIASFSLVGIALGVATLIIVTSVMNGFRKEFTDKVIGFNGHLSLHPISEHIDNDVTIKKLSNIEHIQKSISIVERQALLSNNKTVRGTMCNGISVNDLRKKDLIANNIVDGNLDDFAADDAIIVGASLAKKARIRVGDEIVLLAPELDITGLCAMPRKKTFRLVATFKSGMHEYDSNISFIPITMAQILFKMNNTISCISIFVNNPLNVAKAKRALKNSDFNGYYISDWQDNNSSFMNAVAVERNVMFLILTLIIIVASFNIISCMIMLVKDKEKDIAILRTIGLKKSSIVRIFFIVGASIGVFGTILGSAGGVLFAMNIQKIQALIEALLKTNVFSPEVYFLTHLPSILCLSDVLVTVIVSLLLSCIATFYPARKASNLNPTEILRYA